MAGSVSEYCYLLLDPLMPHELNAPLDFTLLLHLPNNEDKIAKMQF